LIIVGVLMAQSLSKIKWNEMEIAIPSFLILLGMPLTYSISDGIALGFIFYPPTIINAGAVTCEVTTANKGENSKLKINKIPVVIAVIPERPPTGTIKCRVWGKL
jgi:xanthine/uracil/vitamin C permease (AzgA family)